MSQSKGVDVLKTICDPVFLILRAMCLGMRTCMEDAGSQQGYGELKTLKYQ